MHVVLIRHPQTIASLEKRFPKKDETYSHEGRRQFEQLLKNPVCGELITSDLLRCKTLAKAMAEAHDVPLRVDSRIREIDMGVFEGHTFSELEEVFSQDVQEWMREPESFTFPQGESYFEFHRRVREFAQELEEGQYTLITHSGVIHLLMKYWMQKEMLEPFPCGHRVMLFNEDGQWKYRDLTGGMIDE